MPQRGIQTPSLNKDKSNLKLQKNSHAHIPHTSKELNLFRAPYPRLIPWYIICIQIIEELNK